MEYERERVIWDASTMMWRNCIMLIINNRWGLYIADSMKTMDSNSLKVYSFFFKTEDTQRDSERERERHRHEQTHTLEFCWLQFISRTLTTFYDLKWSFFSFHLSCIVIFYYIYSKYCMSICAISRFFVIFIIFLFLFEILLKFSFRFLRIFASSPYICINVRSLVARLHPKKYYFHFWI